MLQYVADERWRLAWISGFTMLLAVGVAFAMGGKKGGSESMVMVVAAYGKLFYSSWRMRGQIVDFYSCCASGVCARREYWIYSVLRRCG